MKLKQTNFINNLRVDFDNGAAVSGNLVCDCGCNKFKVMHTGKQTKGILAPFIVPIKNQLSIVAGCTQCDKRIVLVDNQPDSKEELLLEIKEIKEFNIICKVNYWPENLKNADGSHNNNYEELMLYTMINGKEKAIFE